MIDEVLARPGPRLHWADQYVGLPWVKGGEGPREFNCWGFVRHIQHEHFGRDLPQVRVDDDSPMNFIRELRRNRERDNWIETTAPAEGDCVEMGTGAQVTHIGIWVDVDGGGILHCVRGMGVVFSGRFVMRNDWPMLTFWRHKEIF